MERLLWIRTKEGTEVRLKLKPAQVKLYEAVKQQVAAGQPVRIIVLKARQQGISTEISGILFHACATQANRSAMLVAHVAEATANLHQMHLRFFDRLPARLRPMRAASNAIELVFANPSKDPEERAKRPGLRSRIRCATAGGKGVGRSDTLQYVHASEYAFWPDGINTKADTLLGILQAVPPTAGTMVFIESTARGYDDFYKRWQDAVAGRSDFVPLFFSWADEPGYRKPVPPGTVWSADELELMDKHRLEPEQMAWRRWCIANNCGGDLDKFHQEYPLTPDEAFLATGACWFDTRILMDRIEQLELTPQKPRWGRFVYEKHWDEALQQVTLTGIRFVESERGPVTIWQEPVPGVPYVLGGDTAGQGSDWFTGYVIDNTNARMCARICQQLDEVGYTEQVFCLGLMYNQALIGLEINFSTYPERMLEAMGYRNLYVREVQDQFTRAPTKVFGWRTDSISRPALVSELRAMVEAHPEVILDVELLRQMLVFVKDKDGRPAALVGEHDDLVMGYGITIKIRDQQTAAAPAAPGKKGRYTKDMLEDYRAASPEQKRYLESVWGRP